MAKRQSYAQRKASLRRRTGLTPYQQRLASAAARGLPRAVARGHAREAEERKERRRRIRQRYGVSEGTLRQLRRQVVDYGMAIIEALPINPRPPKNYNQAGEARRELPSRHTIEQGIRLLPAETLREMLGMQVREWQELASVQSPAEEPAYIEDQVQRYQDWTMLFDNGNVTHAGAYEDGEIYRNPWWYHRQGGYQ